MKSVAEMTRAASSRFSECTVRTVLHFQPEVRSKGAMDLAQIIWQPHLACRLLRAFDPYNGNPKNLNVAVNEK